MKKRIIIVILLLCCITTLFAKDRCLLIGIGNYPDYTGWNSISSVNDVNLLKKTLVSNFSVSTLIDQNATHAGIVKAIKTLIEESQPGDTVLIHFSCHGQQVLTTDKNEPDKLDEALVPYDAPNVKSKAYSGENHLLDNELGNLIIPLRKRLGLSGLLIITLDACFSDSMNKGDKDANESTIYRGGADIFGSNEISADSLAKIEDTWKNHDDFTIEKLKNSSNIIMLSACQSYQKNMEIVRNGNGYGSLSYAMFLSFNDSGFEDVGQWLDDVLKNMSNIAYMQTPQIRTTLDIKTVREQEKLPSKQSSSEKTVPYPNKEISLAIFIFVVLILIGLIVWKKRKR